MVPVGDLYFLVDQLATVRVAVYRQFQVLSWLYVGCIGLTHPLQVLLKGLISRTLLYDPHCQLPQQQSLDQIIPNQVMVSLRYLPVERLHLIIDNLIVENQRSVSLDLHLEIKRITGDLFRIVFHNLTDIVILILVFLKIRERLVHVLLVDMREPKLHLIREVLGGLDVD